MQRAPIARGSLHSRGNSFPAPDLGGHLLQSRQQDGLQQLLLALGRAVLEHEAQFLEHRRRTAEQDRLGQLAALVVLRYRQDLQRYLVGRLGGDRCLLMRVGRGRKARQRLWIGGAKKPRESRGVLLRL